MSDILLTDVINGLAALILLFAYRALRSR